MNEFDRMHNMAKMYKEMYKPGTRIEVEYMGDDPRPIAPGTRGTVSAVDDIGTIHCDFDNGRRLGLVPEVDSFRKLTQAELEAEQKKVSLSDRIAEAEQRNDRSSEKEAPQHNLPDLGR